MRAHGKQKIQKQLEKYITELKEGTKFHSIFLFEKYTFNSQSGLIVSSKLYCINCCNWLNCKKCFYYRVPSIRESQGEIYFSGKSGKVREFVPFRQNQGIIFSLCVMVRESQGICSDSAQTLCNFLCSVSKYAYHA